MRGRPLFLGAPVPPSFCARRVVVAAGEARPYDEADWAGAIVVVERGVVEFECARGSRRRFGRGSVLWLQGLPLRTLHACGHDALVLLAVSRGRCDEFQGGGPSDRENAKDVGRESGMTDETRKRG
jgi:hypothetical protein